MNKLLLPILSLIVLVSCNSGNDDMDPGDGAPEGFTLIWSDEFDSNISETNWNFETGDGTDFGLPPGWGNNELQLYTTSGNNATVRPDDDGNSVLAITARKNGDEFTSAKLTTENLLEVRYGRIEARIKVPEGKGIWPAFWMLGTNRPEVDWPGCGEIDIMEVIGSDPATLHTTVHYTNSENKWRNNGNATKNDQPLSQSYHVYAVDWTDESLTFLFDNKPVYNVVIEEDMKEFLRSFYLILNVAVGGNWPGDPDETTVFPQTMFIDWVRVYQNDALDPEAPPTLNIEEETIGSVSTTISPFALNESMDQFGTPELNSYGDGGEPAFSLSDQVVDGDSSILFSYPGGSWGGAFFVMEPTIDATNYANGNLKFSVVKPEQLFDAEIKLESTATDHSLFLKDYSPVEVDNGFVEYTIPISDFTELDLSDLRIPFSLWNPVNENGEYVEMEVILDNVYFEE